ncbi:hypothetical protein C8Q77DRAFT_1159630 [Trametes polyzona]|nr:hypothetical protein C8Q77DRAFT_1159630 [Trametes polyzona]
MARFGVAQGALFERLYVRSAVTLHFLQEEPSVVTALVLKTQGRVLLVLKNHVEGDIVVAFRLGTKKDRASKRWAVRVAWKAPVEGILGEHLDFEAPGGLKSEACLRCAFCSISPPWSSYHDHAQCPYLGTLNKVREHLHVEHAMVLADNRIRLTCAQKPIELKVFLAEDKKWKAEIERKVGELTATLKGGKKHKSADDAPGPSKPAKMPKKEKREKAPGKQEGGSKDTKGKGKAKD